MSLVDNQMQYVDPNTMDYNGQALKKFVCEIPSSSISLENVIGRGNTFFEFDLIDLSPYPIYHAWHRGLLLSRLAHKKRRQINGSSLPMWSSHYCKYIL